MKAPGMHNTKQNLADSWIELKDSGFSYYYNEISGVKQWEKPLRFCNVSGFEAAKEAALDIDGVVYYKSGSTGEISVKKPLNYGKPSPPRKRSPGMSRMANHGLMAVNSCFPHL